MTSDGIKSKRRRLRRQRADFSVRNQAKLNQRLKTVADSQDQPVPLFQKKLYRLPDHGAAKCSGNKFARSVRLVSCAEAAGKHDNLRPVDQTLHFRDRRLDICGIQILKDQRSDSRAFFFKGFDRIVFAVGAWKHRDEYARLGKPDAAFRSVCFRMRRNLHDSSCRRRGFLRKDAVKRRSPNRKHLLYGNSAVPVNDLRFSRYRAEPQQPRIQLFCPRIGSKLQQQGAVALRK